MVLISIQPFALRKLFLVIAALIGFSAVCFADPLFVAQRHSMPAIRPASQFERVDFPAGRLMLRPVSDDPASPSDPEKELAPVASILGNMRYA